ncbi:unnamed protein product [Pleuronectes platessa]|uniref:Ig-like domain-containing protein n=1 Tax=Pleuronectes platessa TaxID=8262 RepID=A0A9N7VFL8_PLEPL|nr:unnamed protein product [Pleuronectes platessa]
MAGSDWPAGHGKNQSAQFVECWTVSWPRLVADQLAKIPKALLVSAKKTSSTRLNVPPTLNHAERPDKATPEQPQREQERSAEKWTETPDKHAPSMKLSFRESVQRQTEKRPGRALLSFELNDKMTALSWSGGRDRLRVPDSSEPTRRKESSTPPLLSFTDAFPPVLSVFQQTFNATADYQESVTLTCITSGSPDPVVTWHSGRGSSLTEHSPEAPALPPQPSVSTEKPHSELSSISPAPPSLPTCLVPDHSVKKHRNERKGFGVNNNHNPIYSFFLMSPLPVISSLPVAFPVIPCASWVMDYLSAVSQYNDIQCRSRPPPHCPSQR